MRRLACFSVNYSAQWNVFCAKHLLIRISSLNDIVASIRHSVVDPTVNFSVLRQKKTGIEMITFYKLLLLILIT